MRKIQAQDSKTIIFVTHDVEEAVFLADKIVVFSKRPARIAEIVDVAAVFGKERTLEMRDSETFFRLRNDVLRMVRKSAGTLQ